MTFYEKTKKFFSVLDGAWFLVFLSILKFACWAIFALVSVLLIRESVRLYWISDTESLKRLVIYYGIFSLIYLIITWTLRMTDWPNLYYKIVDTIYKRYIWRLFLLDGNYIEKIGTGKFIAIIWAWEKAWVEWLTSIIKEWTRMVIILTFILYLFFHENFIYGVIFMLVLIALHSIVLYADGIAHRYRHERTKKKNEHTRQLVRLIMSRSEILQSGKIEDELHHNSELIKEIGDTNRGINSALYIIFNSVRIFIILLKLCLLGFLIYSGAAQIITPADLAGLLALFLVFEWFLYDFVEFYKNFSKEFSDVEKIWEVFDDGPMMKWYTTWLTFTAQNKDIEIQSISYGYNESKVFSDFSLTIQRGKKTALVGASWGGKTTLMKLIAGYLHPESGSIFVLWNVLSETALKSYYPHIGYLTQDPSIFDATIRENLISALPSLQRGMPEGQGDLFLEKSEQNPQSATEQADSSFTKELTEQKLITTLKLAQCDFVFDLEKWLDTEIGERGVRLSGGQKQRLAIAKIFLKNPEIILLDEPTSALDSFSEEKITVALDELFVGRTVIIVAHRLQTVKRADDIIVIEWGDVVERWDHGELVAKWGIYYRMLELQSGF